MLDKITLLSKLKINRIESRCINLNRIKFLNFKALINSNISNDEFVLINNDLKEYDEMK